LPSYLPSSGPMSASTRPTAIPTVPLSSYPSHQLTIDSLQPTLHPTKSDMPSSLPTKLMPLPTKTPTSEPTSATTISPFQLPSHYPSYAPSPSTLSTTNEPSVLITQEPSQSHLNHSDKEVVFSTVRNVVNRIKRNCWKKLFGDGWRRINIR
jgi:hypothetical protein